MDFIRGAHLSDGGKPIIALASRSKKGHAKIVSSLKPGAGVVTTRAHVHYVITEYGVANLCGAFVRVTGRKGSVIVRIVDKCPDTGCVVGHLDLSREAFARIDDIPLGFVPITWQIVSPEMNGPIRFEFKEKNQWWTAVQVRNHRNPIAKFEYRLSNGTFKQVARTDYNYFVEASGMGPGPYTFRVTDILGNVIVSSNIPLSNPGVEINGSGQFPPP